MEYQAGHQDADELEALRHLYPALSDEQLMEAQFNLDRYVALMAQMYERIKANPQAHSEFRKAFDRPTSGQTVQPNGDTIPRS